MSLTTTLSRVALLLLTLVPGCASSDEGTTDGQSEDDIQRGKAARSYLAVGMVNFRSGAFGTGALIRPNVVLTAGHVAIGSVDTFHYGSPPPGKDTNFKNLLSVTISASALGDCYSHGAANGHPAYKAPASCPGELDVGLVKLAKPITDVTPLRMYEGGFEWLEDAMQEKPEAIAVGFGCHTLSDNKTQVYSERRYATSLFDSLTKTEVVVKAGTGIATGGDSGGPLLYNGFIIGTVRSGVEFTKDGNKCGRVKEGYVRIDRTRDWVKSQLKAWGAL